VAIRFLSGGTPRLIPHLRADPLVDCDNVFSGPFMKDFTSPPMIAKVVTVCLLLVMLDVLAGCGFSYNAAGEKAFASYATPVLSCAANPNNVVSGNNALIAAHAVSPLGLPLTYSFGASSGTITSQGGSATLNTQTAFGNVAVTCNVVDTKGNHSSLTTMVAVQPNESLPPTISCAANPTTITLGGSVTITSQASSPEGRPLTYSWSTSSGTISGTGDKATLNTSGTVAGAVTVNCQVADDQGRTGSATTPVTVTAPPPPMISCSAKPATVGLGGSVAVSAVASSPEDRPLTYSWATSSGAISGSGSAVTLNTSGAATGAITVTCKVADDQGRTASATTAITVTAPAPPTISCSANPATVALGGNVGLSAMATSPEGGPLTYNWSATAGSISGSGSAATLNTRGTAVGTIAVTCKVADSQGLTASASTPIKVTAPAQVPPTVSCSANPSAVTLGGSVAVVSKASSPDGGPLTYSWSTTGGAIAGSGNTATLNTNGAAAGNITVTCKVADNQGLSASSTTAITAQTSSTPPTISCLATPSTINQGGTTTITATGASAQNLPLTYSYSVSAGSISGTGSTATLGTSGVAAGTLTVTCTADQQGGGTASATTNVLVQSVAGEQALTNFQFTDSVGVNLHLAFPGTIYQTQFPQIMQAMIALGITHYRDGLNQYALPFQYQNAEALGKAGMKADWLMDSHNSASIINSAYEYAPDATAGFEGPNEDDADVGFNLSTFMQLLKSTVRSNPATAAMPIIDPSFLNVSSFGIQGSLGPLVNYGNMHDYFGNYNPETGSYGSNFYNCGGYGSMQFNICLAQMVSGGQPAVSTETGYQSGTGLSDAIIGRYELRTLFEGLNLGVARTYIYEMIDDASGNWGLLTANFTPRPAYTAIQNVLALLKDVNFTQPGKLNYSLTGGMQNVNHVLLQKSDGTFYIAIWLAVPGADPGNPSSTFNVAPQNVTLTANTPIGATTTYVLDDSGNMTSTTEQLTNGSMPIVVTDRVTLIALSPGQSQ
jgi:hypothetical protein